MPVDLVGVAINCGCFVCARCVQVMYIMYIIDWITIVLTFVFCSSLVVYYALRRLTRRRIPLKAHTGRVLFVTAHPDDECMFFAPTILFLTRSGQYDVFLLCLSSGDCYQRMAVALTESCSVT